MADELNIKQLNIIEKQIALSSRSLGKNETVKNLVNKNMFLDIEFDSILLTRELYSAFSRLGAKPIEVRGRTATISQGLNKLREPQIQAIHSTLCHQFNVNKIEVKVIDQAEIIEYLNYVKNDFLSLDLKIDYAIQHPDEDGMVPELVNAIISDALHLSASDIHIEHKNDVLENWISYRIHGELVRKYVLPSTLIAPLFVRVKVQSGMDIAQTTLEMDGQLSVVINNNLLSLRAAYTPLSNGEKITLRIADASKIKSLEANFIDYPVIRSNLMDIINVRKGSGGLVLLTGSTGSGKTTTLLGALKSMRRESLNIMTVEDPVEMEIPFVNHIQVNNKANMTFNRTLKSMLRQDPDVILVGELRDTETVEVAIRAADTGHMVLTTLHASSVQGAFNRLMGMLSDEFSALGKRSLANQAKAIINQTLATKACSYCADSYSENDPYYPAAIKKLSKYIPIEDDLLKKVKFINPTGCSHCGHTGTDGRLLLPEAIIFKGNRKEKAEQERVIASMDSEVDILSLAGVEYFSFENSCLEMLRTGKLSAGEALKMLETI